MAVDGSLSINGAVLGRREKLHPSPNGHTKKKKTATKPILHNRGQPVGRSEGKRSMAKCGSSRRSSEPLQGMLLVVVLVVVAASLDAGRVMAWDVEGQLIDGLETLVLKGVGKLKMSEKFKELLEGFKAGRKGYKTVKKFYNLLIEQAPVEVIASVSVAGGPKLPVLGVDISSSAMAEIGSCAATSLGVNQLQVAPIIRLYGRLSSTTSGGKPMKSVFGAKFLCYPGVGTSAVLGLGRGGELESHSLTTFIFSYLVVQEPRGGSVNAFAWFGPAWQQPGRRWISTPLVFNPMHPNMYYVTITRILVDNQDILQAPQGIIASLSTTEPFTSLESGAYDRLKHALAERLLHVNRVLPAPANNPNQLCYMLTPKLKAVRFPSVSIEFANNAVMQLGAANLLQSSPYGYDCLAIRPTPDRGLDSVLGSVLQSGTPMTIQVVPRGREGTLTFYTPV